MLHVSLHKDAARQFAQDGRIDSHEAGQLRDRALNNGRVSKNERVTLKALMGFYAPQMEPGAEDILAQVAGSDPSATSSISSEIYADKTVSLGELKDAEQHIAQKYGPQRAKEMLIEILGQDPKRIEFEALDYIQGRVGSMNGHIDGFQKVLKAHIAGAKLLDANFDGKLDENDLVFTKDAQGQVQIEKIGKALSDRVRIGESIVRASHEMAKAKHGFGDLDFNPGAWHADEDEDFPTTMYANPGVPASVALMDIFNNPDMYQFECATAQVIVRYRAMLDLLGEEDFNRICGDLRIGVWDQEDHAAEIWKVSGRASAAGGHEEVTMPEAERGKVKPGDYTYFKNWDVSPSAKEAGWQGENVIALGDGMYYGHPFGIVSDEKIIQYLNKNRNPGSTRSASLLDLHARVDSKLLEWDVTPNK